MALENAKQFVEKVKADAALNERVKGMSSQEGLALAKELGLEFTEEELKAALGVEELSLEEMDDVAGGFGLIAQHARKRDKCSGSSDGNHAWVKTGHEEEPHSFLWVDYTKGYDLYTCSRCGKTKKTRT